MANISSHATRKVVHGLNNADAAVEVIARIDTAGVMSVFGRSGNVVAMTADYAASQVTNAVDSTATYADPSWITSIAGGKVSGDISGYSASITGSIAESQVTGLTSDLAAKAPLASPSFTGNISTSGALSLTGTGQVSFTTPQGTVVNTKLLIPLFDPGAFSSVVYMGLPSTAVANSRAFCCFDARTVVHHPTMGVFSPDEVDLLGFSWDGNNAGGTCYLKCYSSAIAMLISTTVCLTVNTSGGAAQVGFLGATPVSRQTGGAATAGGTYTSTEQTMINAMYTALRNYGLLT